ncbi:MAG TPA: hypothetical protein VGB55_13520, partial [Tepidisphaeraceae bacterium]
LLNPQVQPERVVGELRSKDPVQPFSGFVRADEKIANIYVVTGAFPPEGNESKRFSVAIALLQLNFQHPLGRVSVIEIGADKALIVICETMFFLRDLHESCMDEVRHRYHTLRELSAAARTAVGIAE